MWVILALKRSHKSELEIFVKDCYRSVMNTEEEYTKVSRRLSRSTIGLIAFEFTLFVLVLVSNATGILEKTHIPLEIMLFGIFIIGMFGALFILSLTYLAGDLETQLWKEIAEQFGYTYEERPGIQSNALIFQEGEKKYTQRGLSGILHNHPFRFFQYCYVTGSKDRPKTHNYCISEITFNGTFPHIYLNNTKNRNISFLKGLLLPQLSLPAELEGKFDLHSPTEYEIETLEIFTPDLLLHLLTMEWEHDLELVDQKLFVFREKPIQTKKEIADEIEQLKKLLEILAPKLNHLKLTPIGDRSTIL